MRPLIVLLLIVLLIAILEITGCKRASEVTPPVLPISFPSVEPTPRSVAIPGFKTEWTDLVLADLKAGKVSSFDKAEDFSRFCPLYRELSREDRSVAVGYFISGIAKYESGYDPTVTFKESDGSSSIGLLQLSYGNHGCPRSAADGDLKDPLVNLRCGLGIIAYLVDRDSLVASGGYKAYGAPPARGAAAYFSTLRVPDRKSPHKLAEIIEFTKQAPGCLHVSD